MKTCSVADCTDKYYAVGLCGKHYSRKKKGQSLTEKSVYQMTDFERLQQKFTVAPSGCWEWNSPRPDNRANTFLYQGTVQIAYRASWKIRNGAIPDGLCVLHRCDNGLCVNPEHLFLGTHMDNRNDMLSKGRDNVAKGERVTSAKLTANDVADIKASKLNGNQLSKIYGVHRRTIYDILDGKTWTHIIPSNMLHAIKPD